MNNIPDNALIEVQQKIDALLIELNKGIDWADQYLKAENKRKTGYALRKSRRKLKNIHKALLQRPSAALFGESQVGKSYLIKTFLSDDKGKFSITAPDGRSVPFLEEINPKGGGVESTSVVCRFSTKVNAPDPDYPLVGKLLSVKEIILMLCDTYFNDVKNHINLPTPGKINEKIQYLQDTFGNSSFQQYVLQEDDIYDVKEYLEQHFSSFIGTNSLDDYWELLGRIIHRIDYKNWYEALDVIFGRNEYVHKIFDLLIAELHRLDFKEEVYLEFDAVLRKHGTILNVARLRELNDEPRFEDVIRKEDFKSEVAVKWEVNGQLNAVRQVNKSRLCAVLAEIAFKVDEAKEEEVAFLKNSDLLDFPGAQPRLENNEEEVADKHISEMVLRGKVGYLFNKYSAQYLISNLLLCHHNRDLKAKSISSLLNTWINNFIGSTPEEREAFLKTVPVPPLFKVFTYFNVDLAFDAINDQDEESYGSKWNKRFQVIFEDQIVNAASYNWHESWTVSQPTFQNNYLLRDFYYSTEIFSGFAENGREKAFKEVAVPGYFDRVKESFMESELVKKYFQNPEKSWDKAATVNRDGSNWILDNLTKVSGNASKTHKFIRDLDATCAQITKDLQKHFHSDDSDDQILKANSNADELRFHLANIFGAKPEVFGDFIKTFTIREDKIYEFYRDALNDIENSRPKNFSNYVAIRVDCEGLSPQASYEDNLQVIVDTYAHFSSPEEAESKLQEQGINLQYLFYGDDSISIKNNSEMLAEGVVRLWMEGFKEDRFQFILDRGMTAQALQNLFDNLRVSVLRHDIQEYIAQEIRDYVDGLDKVDEVVFMIADISAGIINNYFNSMGWSYYSEDERENIRRADQENELKLKFERLENSLDYRDNADIAKLFDQMQNYTTEINKVPPSPEVINRYPNFWNFNRWSELMKISFIATCDIPTYDLKANQHLGGIINDLKNFSFNADELSDS